MSELGDEVTMELNTAIVDVLRRHKLNLGYVLLYPYPEGLDIATNLRRDLIPLVIHKAAEDIDTEPSEAKELKTS